MSDNIEYTFDPETYVAPEGADAGPPQYQYTYDNTVEPPAIQNPEGPQQYATPQYTPTGAQSLDPNNSYNQLLAGVGIAKDFNYLGDTTSRTMENIDAPYSSAPATPTSWVDKLFALAGEVKPDTWANLAGKALTGYAQGKAADEQNAIVRERLDLEKKKQSVAQDSAIGVKRPGLIGTYKSMFANKGQ